MPIPYELIDCEIRPLVTLLNRVPGVTTLFSCAGHSEGEESYVTFRVRSRRALAAVLNALPCESWNAVLVGNRLHWKSVQVTARTADGDLHYDLRIAGSPLYEQRAALGELERRLTTALSGRPRPKRLSCSKRGTAHSAGKGQRCC